MLLLQYSLFVLKLKPLFFFSETSDGGGGVRVV